MSNFLNRFSSWVVQHVIPKPCTAKYIAEIETWVKTKEVRSKEEVMLAEFGYADERAIPAVSLPLHRSLHCPVLGRGGREGRGGGEIRKPGFWTYFGMRGRIVLVSVS